MRRAEITRNTLETQISINLNFDGTGRSVLNTGIPFLDHMLDQIARHGLIDLGITARIGDFDVDLIHEFFQGFVNHALVTLHIDNLAGRNAHHQAETIFKAFGRTLRMAIEHDHAAAGIIPSTKGTL